MSDTPSPDWIDDSKLWHGGIVLAGRFAHWCACWDDLPIDETCPEFAACLCYEDDAEAQRFRDEHNSVAERLLAEKGLPF